MLRLSERHLFILFLGGLQFEGTSDLEMRAQGRRLER